MTKELPWVDGEGYANSALAGGITVDVREIVSECRAMYGADGYADIVSDGSRPVPVTDWRFTVRYPDGARSTFHAGATAEHVGEYIRRELVERPDRLILPSSEEAS